MFRKSPLAIGAILALLSRRAVTIDFTRFPGLMAKLDTAATQLDRLGLLPNDDDWVFDFSQQQPFFTTRPGGVANMNAATFPPARKNGLTLAIVQLGPCAMLPPHYHPRAANWVVAITGNTTTWMQEENGAHTITTHLTPMKATIFPAGALHMMGNEACEDAMMVSALTDEDAGTLNIGNIFTNGFDWDWVNAAFGGDVLNEESAAHIRPIGTGANWGSRKCMARCGIDPYNTTTTTNTTETSAAHNETSSENPRTRPRLP
ncbi:Spherulin-1A [Fulvia fulva]|uniref:Spherulin-1A n=1 Tax=Passalora fulva TaxID=5499 RepID=A0A9Q8PGG9_PASFU|nr:Spherulin-1A [Fulvia fulva]UJO22033.1 Spherulin-1A [Fulvia fulva]